MRDGHRLRVARLALLLVAATIVSTPVGAAHAAGPLEGKELSIANEVRSGLDSVEGSLLGGDLRGRISRVVVDEDEARRLNVSVSYEGFSGARIWAELLNGDRRLQAGATECSACKMQMEQGTQKATIHPIKLLALAYGLMPEVSELFSAQVEELVVT